MYGVVMQSLYYNWTRPLTLRLARRLHSEQRRAATSKNPTTCALPSGVIQQLDTSPHRWKTREFMPSSSIMFSEENTRRLFADFHTKAQQIFSRET